MKAPDANADPAIAWKALAEGNARFVAGKPEHRGQTIEHRARLAASQKPIAMLFGCADSRVAAEIIFDQGLGEMFVVRTAGHVIDSAVLGSIDYAVTVLNVALIVVLGHDDCGAVKATLRALDGGAIPNGYVRDIVERVVPSILLGRRDGLTPVRDLEARHVTETVAQLCNRSAAIAERLDAATLAIVGATYQLADGRVKLRDIRGDVRAGERLHVPLGDDSPEYTPLGICRCRVRKECRTSSGGSGAQGCALRSKRQHRSTELWAALAGDSAAWRSLRSQPPPFRSPWRVMSAPRRCWWA